MKKDFSENETQSLRDSLRILCFHLAKKWKQSKRTEARFLKSNENWLKKEFVWPKSVNKVKPSLSKSIKPFEELSNKQKRRRTEGMRKESVAVLSFALSTKMREGRLDFDI